MSDGDVAFSSSNKPFDFGLLKKDVPYVDDDKKEHLLDILYPKKEKDNGILLFNVHGGGYVYGYKEDSLIFASIFANKGFTVISMNYHLMESKKDLSIKDQIQDVLKSVIFIVSNKENLKLNYSKICLMGDSAGGHIAMMVALALKNPFLRKYYDVETTLNVEISSMVLSSPMYDFYQLKQLASLVINKEGMETLFSKFYKNKSLLRANSPKAYLSVGFVLPPILLVYSKSDIFKFQSIKLKKEYKNLNRKLEIHYEPDKKCGHIFHHFSVNEPTTIKANNAIENFLLKN